MTPEKVCVCALGHLSSVTVPEAHVISYSERRAVLHLGEEKHFPVGTHSTDPVLNIRCLSLGVFDD